MTIRAMRFRLIPLIAIFAAGLAYAVLPRGAFGPYDIASRAAVTGVVASVTFLLVLLLTKRRKHSRR